MDDGNLWLGGLYGILVVFGPAYIVYGILLAVGAVGSRSRGRGSSEDRDAGAARHEPAAEPQAA